MAKLSFGRQELIGIDNIPPEMVQGLVDLAGAAVQLRGAYSSTVAYKKNDVVTSGGKVYLALRDAPSGTALTDTGTYILFSGADGRDGNDGRNGTNGNDGQPGRNGTNGNDGNDGQPGADGSGYSGVTTSKVGRNQTVTFNPLNGAAPASVVVQDGADGNDGRNGTNGNDGEDGNDGAPGASGATFPTDASDGDVLAWDGTMGVSVRKDAFGRRSDSQVVFTGGRAGTSNINTCQGGGIVYLTPAGAAVRPVSIAFSTNIEATRDGMDYADDFFTALTLGTTTNATASGTTITFSDTANLNSSLALNVTFNTRIGASGGLPPFNVILAWSPSNGVLSGIRIARIDLTNLQDTRVIALVMSVTYVDGVTLTSCEHIVNLRNNRFVPQTGGTANQFLGLNSDATAIEYKAAPSPTAPLVLVSEGGTAVTSVALSPDDRSGRSWLVVVFAQSSNRKTTARFLLSEPQGTYTRAVVDSSTGISLVIGTSETSWTLSRTTGSSVTIRAAYLT